MAKGDFQGFGASASGFCRSGLRVDCLAENPKCSSFVLVLLSYCSLRTVKLGLCGGMRGGFGKARD